MPASVADETVEGQVQVDPAPPRVRGEPVVAAVEIPAGAQFNCSFDFTSEFLSDLQQQKTQ